MQDMWTKEQIPSLDGKVIIVTGANSGIGYEAAKELARKGAQVILACRSMKKAQAAERQILLDLPSAHLETMHLDLASLDSVRTFSEGFRQKYRHLHLLINNAGIMMVPYALTEDGFESQFATNHLGHFSLTGLLINLLLATPDSRVVNVSSIAHRFGRMEVGKLLSEDGIGYSPTSAYGRSKLANVLFTHELQRRLNEREAQVLALTAHPGISSTNLGNHLEKGWISKLFEPISHHWTQSAAMGALPTLRAAVDPHAAGGSFYGPDGWMELTGNPILIRASRASRNEARANELWRVSEQMTGVAFL